MVPAIDVLLRRQLGCSKARHKPVRRRNALENAVFVSPIMAPLARRGAEPPLRLASEAPILKVRATQGDFSMNLIAAPARVMLAAAVLAGLALPASAQGSGTTALASHRAVYDLKLSSTRGKRSNAAILAKLKVSTLIERPAR
jgi:hypothetical protein